MAVRLSLKAPTHGRMHTRSRFGDEQIVQSKRKRVNTSPSFCSPPLLCICVNFAPYWACPQSLPARRNIVSRKTKAATHLGDSLLISHDSLLDECVDFNIPIPARHNHPGPAKTHRDFHGLVSEIFTRFGAKPRREEEEKSARKLKGAWVFRLLCSEAVPVFLHRSES